MKTFLSICLTAAATAAITWWAVRPTPSSSAAEERKPLFYQSAMHPWIKSDKPGRCTICGMELTPIYPGDPVADASAGGSVVALSHEQAVVLGVRTAAAAVRPLEKNLQVAGMIDDDDTRHRVISAYVDGRIDQLSVNYLGAEVTAGQPLAAFYSPTLLQAEREYRLLTGELRSATALRLRQMGLTQTQIEALPDKSSGSLVSEILAPIGGTVVARDVYEGQYVTTGQKLFEIADFSTMWFQFLAYEQDMPWLKTGLTVVVTTPSLPAKSFEGKIRFIDPNFDEATRATKVRVELANPQVDGKRQLLHRLYADGLVKIEWLESLVVPRSAVIETGPEAVVYRDQGGDAYARTVVKLGRHGDSEVEVLAGLKAGDKVVTQGNLLIDGQAELNRSFNPEEPTAAAAGGDLTAAQQSALAAFIHGTDSMAVALAADDLAAFNAAAGPAMEITGKLTEVLNDGVKHPAALDALGQSSHLHGFKDLKAARAGFFKFIMAATDVLQPLRRMGGFPNMQIWQCPMVDQAIPGAPAKGRWIQTGGRPIQNPFFGAEMLDCGSEIQP